MGTLMDTIADTRGDEDAFPDAAEFAAHLKTIKDDCHWISGDWDFGDGVVLRWNHLQNTHRDIQRLTDFLVGRYRATRIQSQ